VRQQFIQDLLNDMRCICGRPLTDGSPEHQRLLNLMKRTLPGSVEDDVLSTSSVIKKFLDGTTHHRAELDDQMKRRAEVTEIIKSLTAQLDDVKRQLKGSSLEEIGELEKKREEFAQDIERHTMDIGGCNLQIDSLTKNMAHLSKEIAAAEKDEKRVRLLNTKRELAQEGADAIGEMYAAFADGMREKIEAKTKEIFGKLVWKDSQWQDVRLGPDFNLEVIDRYGTPARPELSAGERQVLSLSFITAMSRVSEEEAPLVMDTPFGRLSSQHRNNITKYIPGLADQLVLFVTDEELRDEARENLEPRIGKEYRLVFDKQTGCTSIEVEK
jgi:DNA sulfur modification protein DndD